MNVNRMSEYFAQQDRSLERMTNGSFALNPLVPQAAPWQMQIYQAAFMQAQQAVEAEERENAWPLAEWWN